MLARESLTERNAALLEESLALAQRLDDTDFSRPVDGVRGGVGAQLRHCLDFYENFLAGLDRGDVDYDRRARDRRVEQDPELARRRLRTLIERLRDLEVDPARPLRVRSEAGTVGEWVASTAGRELQFLLSHTVHHHAMIALILRGRGEELPATFGVAPSTLAAPGPAGSRPAGPSAECAR